jgi:hypothetical protein
MPHLHRGRLRLLSKDTVEVVLDFADGTWSVTPPIPRWRAEDLCRDFAEGVPWVNGLRVTRALIRTVNGVLN